MALKIVESMVSDRGIRGRWGVVATLIGYVALVGYAVFAQPEYRSPIAQAGNAVEANADRKSDSSQAPPYPVATLKALRAAEDAGTADCGASEECRAKQRDYADLQAQWEAAKGAEGQLRFARWQTFIAGFGTVLVAVALLYTAKATTAAIEANRISREAYFADQRPWIAFDAKLNGPITYGVNGCSISFEFTLSNVGKTPAMHTDVSYEIIHEWGDMDMAKHQRRISDRVAANNAEGYGNTIFPGQVFPSSYGGMISREELERGLALWQSRYNDSAYMISLHLVGCVFYRSSITNAQHQTGFIRQVYRTAPRLGFAFRPAEGDVPLENLVLLHCHEDGRVT